MIFENFMIAVVRDAVLTILLSGILLFTGNAVSSPLFEDDAIIDAQLRGPIRALLKKKGDSAELPFTLTANGSEYSVQIRLRGKSRRRVCSFPPLRLRFNDDDIAQTEFAGQRKLKLVTHCAKSTAAQTNALQEYAAYRIFSLISDVGYRARLLRISYVDTEASGNDEPLERYAFLIESEQDMAARLGGQPVQVQGVSLRSFDQQHLAAVYVFQYLIGNTDWSLVTAENDDACCHNGDLMDIASQRYYIPYDFDLAGLVNARYAYPERSLGIRSVTNRLYRGFCMSVEPLQAALLAIKTRRNDILQVIHTLPALSDKERAASARYLEKFFAEAGNEKKLLRSFEERCL